MDRVNSLFIVRFFLLLRMRFIVHGQQGNAERLVFGAWHPPCPALRSMLISPHSRAATTVGVTAQKGVGTT